MIQNSAIDRCVDEISSTLELAQALESQLERVRDAVSREQQEEDAVLTSTEI